MQVSVKNYNVVLDYDELANLEFILECIIDRSNPSEGLIEFSQDLLKEIKSL